MPCIEISSGGSGRESYVIVPSFTFEVCCSFGVGSEILDGKDGKIIGVTHMIMLQTHEPEILASPKLYIWIHRSLHGRELPTCSLAA